MLAPKETTPKSTSTTTKTATTPGKESPIQQTPQTSPLQVTNNNPQPPFIENGQVIVPKHFRFYGRAAILKQPDASTQLQAIVTEWENKWNQHPVTVTINGQQYPLIFRFTASRIATEQEAKEAIAGNLNLKATASQAASTFHPEWAFVRVEDIDASARNSRLGKGLTTEFDGTRLSSSPQMSADNSIFLPSALLRSNNAVHELIHQFLSRSEISHIQGRDGIVNRPENTPVLSIRTIRMVTCHPQIPNSLKVKDAQGRAQIFVDRGGTPTVIAVEKPADKATDATGATYTRIKPDGTDGDAVTYETLQKEEKSKHGLNYFFQTDLREVTAADKQLIIDRYFGAGLPPMVGGATNTYFDAAGNEFYFDQETTIDWRQY